MELIKELLQIIEGKFEIHAEKFYALDPITKRVSGGPWDTTKEAEDDIKESGGDDDVEIVKGSSLKKYQFESMGAYPLTVVALRAFPNGKKKHSSEEVTSVSGPNDKVKLKDRPKKKPLFNK